MSRARELAKVGGKNQQVVAGLSSHVGVSTFASDVFMYSNLEVTGTTTFNGGTLTLGDANTDNIVFGGEVDSHIIPDDDGTYNLGSATKEWNNLFVDGTANIDALLADTAKIGDLTDNRVVIAGSSGELEDSGNLTFDGSILTTTNIVVTGDTDLGNATSDTITATGRFDSDLTPSTDGARDLGQSDLEWQDLFIDGTAKIDTLTVDENATVAGNLTVTGNGVINGNVDLGNATSDTITATGRFDSDLVPSSDNARDLGASGLEWKDLYIDGTANIDTLVADTAKVSDLTSGRVVLAGTSGEIEDSGNLTFNGSTLAVTGSQTISVSLDVDGHTDLDNLGVSGVGTITQLVSTTATVGAGLTVTGTIDGNGGANISGAETVLSSATVSDLTNNRVVIAGTSGALEDSGNLTFNGSTLAITGSIDLSADIDVDGTANLDVVDIDGAVDMASSLTLAGNADFNGNLDVDGTSNLDAVDIDGAVDMASTLTLAGNADFNGDLDVDGTTNLDGTNVAGALAVSGSATVDNLSLDGNTITTSSGNLTISSTGGTTTMSDNVAISGNLTVNGTTTTVNATTVNIADKNIQVATRAADDSAADGGGITIDSGDGDKTFQFEATGDNFGSSENMNLADGKAYKIDNTSVLNETTLGSSVVASSLTSVGTIATGVWNGTAINDTYIGTIDNANKVSLSALNIDGGTDIGAALADADLLIVDDGAGGTNRKMAASRLPTYLFGKVSGDVAIAANGTATIQANSVALSTDTTGNYVAAGAVSGNGLSGSSSSEGGTFTVTSNATNANTGSTIVFRDSSGDFSAGTITASLTGNVTGNTSGSSGSCTGNAATATALANARTIAGVSFDGTANISLNNNAITNGAGYITSSGTSAACSGNSATATIATNSTITANNSTNETVYPVFVDGATGTQGLESDTGLSYNPSSGNLTATTFTGALTGNVTGNTSGSSGSCTGNAATATKLASARTIAGVSFDGSANISLNNNAITNGAGYITATLTTEQVQDIVGGMLTGNTESGITVTYQDGDGTIDFSVASQTDVNFTSSDHSKLVGIESGATADQTASEILTLIKTVDGSGSGLDADTLDGVSSASFLRSDTADGITATLTARAITPEADSTYDLGTNSVRWANVYADDVRTGDLHLSNEHRGGNEVDGTWGHYQIQEGEDDLFLFNKRSGKKYRFLLQQV